MTAVQIIALADVIGKEFELPRRAPALADKARFGQAAFGHRGGRDQIGAGLDLGGDGSWMNASPTFRRPFAIHCAMRAEVPVPQGARSMALSP